jgi:hypothetical protein
MQLLRVIGDGLMTRVFLHKTLANYFGVFYLVVLHKTDIQLFGMVVSQMTLVLMKMLYK